MDQNDLKKIRLFIFDWDGTLADSIGIIAGSLIDSFRDTGLGELGYEHATSVIGLPLVKALEELSPGITPEHHKLLLETYKRHFLLRSSTDSLLFSGARDLLQALRDAGYYVAIATGKSRAGLERDFDICSVRPYINSSRTIDECNPKPDPHMIHSLVSDFKVEYSETIMVGDTTFDLEMAEKAGVASIASSYGAHPREKLLRFKTLGFFDNFQALSQFITSRI